MPLIYKQQFSKERKKKGLIQAMHRIFISMMAIFQIAFLQE
jgi:hypothetical protein